jgi:signal transduction histidine kinase/CheY-like chemotaxis protein
MNQATTKSHRLIDFSFAWLLSLVIACLLLVIGTKIGFDSLQEDLRAQSANERARLFVGEEIVRGIHGIQKDLYLMAASTHQAAAKRVTHSITAQLHKLRHDLNVLKAGGKVRREVQLNLEGRDQMVSEVFYRPTTGDGAYVMELIEISPLLDQVEQRTTELEDLLTRMWAYQDKGDRDGFFHFHDKVDAFLKHIPPYFERLDENANRLFFDSSEQLRVLETRLAVQRERFKLVEMGLVALVIVLAGAITLHYFRRINSAHQRLELALEEMREAKEDAERASRAKSEFVSRMSHELRTPLNAIIGFSQLLESEPLLPSQKHYVNLINSSGNHLMELINAVLDHAKIEAGSMTLERIAFDVSDMITEVRGIVAERASEKGLKFVLDASPDLPRFIMGDPTRLRQVLINLLVNAIKFTEKGSIELGQGVDDGQLIFSVRDSGIGMDSDALERLFQPFSQADQTITRRYGGTGLGLVISKELVEGMGGTIEVDSSPGVGTCFWVHLPLVVADGASPSASRNLPEQHTDIAALVSGRVLLVDDNRVNQQLGAAMLGRLGLVHDTADNGIRALQCISQTTYALILMDMEMPEMDGISATREIRQRERAQGSKSRLPIIALTANALAEDRERCFAAGMDGYVPKPISRNALESEISRLFKGSQTVAPSSAAPAVTVAAEPNDAVFDRAATLEMIGDEALFRELAALYVSQTPGALQELDDALAVSDWPVVARSAHTMKGLFATFSAAPAEAHAKLLEQAATLGNGDACLNLAPALRDHALALAGALDASH